MFSYYYMQCHLNCFYTFKNVNMTFYIFYLSAEFRGLRWILHSPEGYGVEIGHWFSHDSIHCLRSMHSFESGNWLLSSMSNFRLSEWAWLALCYTSPVTGQQWSLKPFCVTYYWRYLFKVTMLYVHQSKFILTQCFPF